MGSHFRFRTLAIQSTLAFVLFLLMPALARVQGGTGAPASAVWVPLGPFGLSDPPRDRILSGRATDVAIDPRDASIMYLGTSNGGVWKTSDRGLSWTPLTDDQSSLAIGALALDPTYPDTVYAGTGRGVLRSDDGGGTWMLLGASDFGGVRVYRLIVNPASKVYAATAAGLFTSTDRGETWRLLLGSRSQAPVTDLALSPADSTVLLAGLGGGGSSATGQGIYRSGDSGGTWELADIGIAPSTRAGVDCRACWTALFVPSSRWQASSY